MTEIDEFKAKLRGEVEPAMERIREMQDQAAEQYREMQFHYAIFLGLSHQIQEATRPWVEAFAESLPGVTPVVTEREFGPAGRVFHGGFVTFSIPRGERCPANIQLRFGLEAGVAVDSLILFHDLEIVPVFIEFERHDQVALPLDPSSVEKAVEWFKRKALAFTKTYVSLFFNPDYQKGLEVPDVVLGRTFPRAFAKDGTKYRGVTYHFLTMAITPPGLAAAVGRAGRWTSRLLSAAAGKFGLLVVALVALMGAAPLIPSAASHAVLALFTGAVLVASLHAARPGGKPVVVGLALALADFLIGRFTSHFGTRWLVLLETVLWMSTLIYVTATILRAIFESREVTVETLLAALCVFLLIGLFWAFAFTLIELTLPGSFRVTHGPGLAWADEQSRTTEFMRLFVLSFSSLSGSNCAEIAPATGFASNAASLEAMTGQIYLAVVIARLVALHATPTPP